MASLLRSSEAGRMPRGRAWRRRTNALLRTVTRRGIAVFRREFAARLVHERTGHAPSDDAGASEAAGPLDSRDLSRRDASGGTRRAAGEADRCGRTGARAPRGRSPLARDARAVRRDRPRL